MWLTTTARSTALEKHSESSHHSLYTPLFRWDDFTR